MGRVYKFKIVEREVKKARQTLYPIIIMLILFLIMSGHLLMTYERENNSLLAGLTDANETILILRTIHIWIPILEQILPRMTKEELNLVTEQLKQTRKRKKK
uniref:Uncharacterized protein n=1 Tax=viral metagenome TaxID=1070528 RepID=A0A6M3LNV9_9ZZZZ